MVIFNSKLLVYQRVNSILPGFSPQPSNDPLLHFPCRRGCHWRRHPWPFQLFAEVCHLCASVQRSLAWHLAWPQPIFSKRLPSNCHQKLPYKKHQHQGTHIEHQKNKKRETTNFTYTVLRRTTLLTMLFEVPEL
jgi:hypothetical protein